MLGFNVLQELLGLRRVVLVILRRVRVELADAQGPLPQVRGNEVGVLELVEKDRVADGVAVDGHRHRLANALVGEG